MLTPANHDWLRNALAAQVEDGIVLDYLQEAEATLPEVLSLYAGPAPEYVDGLPQSALAEWSRRTDSRQPASIRISADTPGDLTAALEKSRQQNWLSLPEGVKIPMRWEMVRDIKITLGDFRILSAGYADFRVLSVAAPASETFEESIRRQILCGIRTVKRRTLALFPEVELVTAECTVSRHMMRDYASRVLGRLAEMVRANPSIEWFYLTWRDAGYFLPEQLVSRCFIPDCPLAVRWDRGTLNVTFQQRRRAPDLIPPEPGRETISLPVFAVGTYGDRVYTRQALESIVANFEANRETFAVRVVRGPEEEMPVCGYLEALRHDNVNLIAGIVIVDGREPVREMASFLRRGTHVRGSVELYDAPPEGCQGQGSMLRRIILMPSAPADTGRLRSSLEYRWDNR